MRTIINFNSGWYFTKGTFSCSGGPKPGLTDGLEAIDLPHTWNAIDGQDGGNDYYRGTCTYIKLFRTPPMEAENRAFLEFQGAAMTADVSLNGERLLCHEGGYSTFRADITAAMKGTGEENLLCVTVDNGVNDRVYPQKADFTFYGGIYRDVNLIIVPKAHFELLKDGALGVKAVPSLEGEKACVSVESFQNTEGRVRFSVFAPDGCGAGYWRDKRREAGPLEDYSVCVAEVTAKAEGGKAAAEIVMGQVRRWHGKKDPYLYALKAELLDERGETSDTVLLRFGFRSFSFDKEQGFFLNGEAYPLRGVSRHQDRAGAGNALTEEMHEEDLNLILEIGATTVRLAHYQHAQYFYDLCDEAGLAVWAEIPYITQHMPNGRGNTLSQMRELIAQNCHHVSIICWGLSNEITAAGAVTQDLLENHRLLNALSHELDGTRPTVMAYAFMLETDSPLIEIADMASYNLYYGWYLGDLDENEAFFDEYHKKYPERIIGFSEYGADANPQYQSAAPEKGDYTESYQCVYHEHILEAIRKRPYLWATHVWNMFDFAADGRDEGGRHGVNQKGLITMDRRLKKDAFYLYKAYWSEEPFVHICGRRYRNRTESSTEIKVYSNGKRIGLYIDGKPAGIQEGEKIFRFRAELTGEHTVEARCEDTNVRDVITLRRAEREDASYQMLKKEEVVNWFDREMPDPTCFSLQDRMGDIMAVPEGAALLEKMMTKARASRGEVAQAAGSNPVLRKMLAKMTVQSILKQAGDTISGEEIRELNAALQRIKKPAAD